MSGNATGLLPSRHFPHCAIFSQGACSCHQQPQMTSLQRLESLVRTSHESISNQLAGFLKVLDDRETIREQGQGRLMARLDEVFEKLIVRITDCSNYECNRLDTLQEVSLQMLGSLENRIMEFRNEMHAGLRGVSDGCAIAIVELRKDLETFEFLRLSSGLSKQYRAILEKRPRKASRRKGRK